MRTVSETVVINDPMEEIMDKFDKTTLEYIPVVDVDHHLIGYIARAKVYSMYRKMVSDYSAD